MTKGYFDYLLPQVTNIRNLPEGAKKDLLIEVAQEKLDEECLGLGTITLEERELLQRVLEGQKTRLFR